MKYKVLSTKNLNPSLHQKARDHQIELIEKEFISIQSLWSYETRQQILSLSKASKFLVFTSANSVNILFNHLPSDHPFFQDKFIFCISGATKDSLVAYKINSNQFRGMAYTGVELAEKIIEEKADSVIFFCGKQRRKELPEMLKREGILVHEITLYDTLQTGEKLAEDYDGVMFFSPSGVKSFFSLNQLKDHTVCFAIGPTSTSRAILDHTSNKLIHSEVPDPEILLERVIDYFKQKSI